MKQVNTFPNDLVNCVESVIYSCEGKIQDDHWEQVTMHGAMLAISKYDLACFILEDLFTKYKDKHKHGY